MNSRIGFITTILLCLMGTAWAQETTGQLEGRILDKQDKAIAAANIVVTSPRLQGERGAATNKDGYFRIIALPPGLYTVKISHIAYQSTTALKAPVRLGKTTALGEIHLQSRTIELPGVVVSGERPIIDPHSTTIGANFQLETIDALPVDRNFRSIATLVPQANISYYSMVGFGGVEQVNISGSTGPENAYFVDGVNTTDSYLAATSTNLPYNFVQEIEIKTGGYQAEFGRALGGILNVITPSGSNEFHGQVFGFFTNNDLGGSTPKLGLTGAEANAFSNADVGFSLGGPVVRDRLWFHAAYNPNFERQPFSLPGIGSLVNKKNSHLFAGKLTWRASDDTDMILSVLGDRSSARTNDFALANFVGGGVEVLNKEVLKRKIETGGAIVSLQVRRTVSQKFLLNGHVSYASTRFNDIPDTEQGRIEPIFIDRLNRTASGGVGFSSENKPSRFSVKLSGTLFLASHELKAGLAYEDNMVDSFQPQERLELQVDSTYQTTSFVFGAKVHNRIPMLFLQDAWQVSKRFRINAGLRWEGQYFIGPEGDLRLRVTDQFQPRVGAIYQPGEIGSAKIYGSYGRYYEQIPTLLPSVTAGNTNITFSFFTENPLDTPSAIPFASGGFDIGQPDLGELEGQYFDEFILGYERNIRDQFKVAVRGSYRRLGQVLKPGVNPETLAWIVGNPGSGSLDFLPRMKRDYQALEISLQKSSRSRFNFLTSYVLSRNSGNYGGLFNQEMAESIPNLGSMPVLPLQITNGAGLLPNDRTHVFKFSGSYRTDIGLTAGASFFWQSGTPISELGKKFVSWDHLYYISKRGSAGRTPAITDVNVRLKYDLGKLASRGFNATLILDALHLLNQRNATEVDQVHFQSVDANDDPIAPNPNYLQPVGFEPARTVRLGMEVKF